MEAASSGRVEPNPVLTEEERLDHARGLAWRALNRRDRTVAEVRALLERERVDPVSVAAVLDEMIDGAWLDDARYAERFADDRRRLDGWGPERIAQRLRGLGVAAEHVEAAVGARDAGDEMDAAVELLRRRFPQPPANAREYQRALGVLVRKGYGLELARDALRRHAGMGEFDA